VKSPTCEISSKLIRFIVHEFGKKMNREYKELKYGKNVYPVPFFNIGLKVLIYTKRFQFYTDLFKFDVLSFNFD